MLWPALQPVFNPQPGNNVSLFQKRAERFVHFSFCVLPVRVCMGINRKHLYQRTQKCSIFDKSFTQPQYTGGDGGATPHFHTESLIIEGRVLSGNKLSKSTGWSQHLWIIAKCSFTLYSLCSMAKLNGFPGDSMVKNKKTKQKKPRLPMQEMLDRQVRSLGGEDPPEEEMANHFQYSCLENCHGQRSLAGYSLWGRQELGWLNDWACTPNWIQGQRYNLIYLSSWPYTYFTYPDSESLK